MTLSDRQGVFVHPFKGGERDLELALFSWRAFRHRTDTDACPVCRGVPHSHAETALGATALR